MFLIAMAIAFFAPLVSVALLVVKLVAAAFAGRLIPVDRVVAWLEAAVTLLCVAGTGYAIGMFDGGFFDLLNDPCDGSVGWSTSLFPLTYSCQYGDGSTRELVPWFVNPVVFLGLAGALISIGLAIRVRWLEAQEFSEVP